MALSGNLTKDEMNNLLSSHYIARLGCCENGKPYIVPVTYAYDPFMQDIFGVSGEGMKMQIIRRNPRVCIEVESIKDIANWQSVIAWGEMEELNGADARNTLHEFVKKVTSLINDENDMQVKFLRDISYSGGEGKAGVVVYRIRIKEWTGKFERLRQ
jgi:nitroimidazol reductase NimA-like FMN-containing flavoprotein (pyridoxamine 5'-phosphate oxidase superfamily)